MVCSVIGFAQRGQRDLGAGSIAGDKDDARALLRQPQSSDFANAGGRARYDNSFGTQNKRLPPETGALYQIRVYQSRPRIIAAGDDAAAFAGAEGPPDLRLFPAHPGISLSMKNCAISILAFSALSEP